MLASAIVEILEDDPGLSVFAASHTGATAVLLATDERVNVVLMDCRLPDMTGAAAARMIKASRPEMVIVFHTADDSELAMLDAVDAGASAYLTKNATAEQIVEAVHRASRGEVQIPVEVFARAIARRRTAATWKRERENLVAAFTPRELDIVHLLAEGLDTVAMSQRLRIARHTVEWHVRHIIEKFQVHSKLQVVIAAARLGVIKVHRSPDVGFDNEIARPSALAALSA